MADTDEASVFVGADADTWGQRAEERFYESKFPVTEVVGTCGHRVMLSNELLPVLQKELDRGVSVQVVCDQCWVPPESEEGAVVVMTHDQYEQLCEIAPKERVDQMIEELGVRLLGPGETHA